VAWGSVLLAQLDQPHSQAPTEAYKRISACLTCWIDLIPDILGGGSGDTWGAYVKE